MGGESPIDTVAARSALAWWMEAGVDVAVGETPRNWLAASPVQPSPASLETAGQDEMPETLEAFRAWLGQSPSLPGADSETRRILPVGDEGAALMVITGAPASEDAGAGGPIDGEAWALTQRMLAAIAVAPDQAYLASVSCLYAPAARLGEADVAAWGKIARRHVALVKPKRLLLFGEMPARALLGVALAQARGHVHKVEGVRTVVTFAPRMLITQPARKADAWRDLLLLMEDQA